MADIKEVLAGVPMPAAGVSGSTIAAFTADQMRTFGEACARAALAGLDTQQTTQLPAPAAGPPWRVALVMSSSGAGKYVPWLATHEQDQQRVEQHRSFIRWLCAPQGDSNG